MTFIEMIDIIPLIISIAIIPLIVFLKVSPAQGGTVFWKSNVDYDFFSYYKSMILIAMGLLSILIMLVKGFKSNLKFKKTKLYIPIVVFLFVVFLSALFSEYQKISWLGFYNRYEGAMAIMAYMILFVYSINFVNTKKQIKLILASFFISLIIIMTIGVFQFFSMDFFRTEFGKGLILPSVFKNQEMNIRLQVEETMVFATFKHPNYYGSFMAIVLPFIACLMILSKKKKHMFFFGLLFAGALFTLMGSRSRAGLLGSAVSLFVLFILLRKIIFKKWKLMLILFLIGFLGIFVSDYLTGGLILGKLKSITSDPRININKKQLEDIVIEASTVKIISANSYLEIENIGNHAIAFKDKQGEYLFYSLDQSQKVIFRDAAYKAYSLQFAKHTQGFGIILVYGNLEANFLITETSFKLIVPGNKLVDLKEIPSWGFKGKELWGSSRGYIWSRTIPMISDTLFIGHGPDTFSIYFPQDDYIGKLISYGQMNIIVDKAHNMYLQMAVNTGLVSLIVILSIFCLYIVSSIKLYEKRPPDDWISRIGAAIMFSVIGYLTAGFFNDSVVSVSTVFWVMLGMGVSINIQIADRAKKEKR